MRETLGAREIESTFWEYLNKSADIPIHSISRVWPGPWRRQRGARVLSPHRKVLSSIGGLGQGKKAAMSRTRKLQF